MEPAPYVVVHAPHGHGVECSRQHVSYRGVFRPAVLVNQQAQAAVRGELRRAAEPTTARVKRLSQCADGLIDELLIHRFGALDILSRSDPLNGLRQLVGLLLYVRAARLPYLRQLGEHLFELLAREIRPSHPGPSVGRQPHRIRPAAGPPGHKLRGQHVLLVNLRAFFPVHLDGDEVLVEDLRHIFSFEGLALHHVTPVAGGITDRQEDGLVLLFRLLQRVFAPRIPVHRVMRVLEKIWAGFVNELVRVLMIGLCGGVTRAGGREGRDSS